MTPSVRAGAGGGELNDRMDAEHEDAARWLEEGHRFLGRWQEELEALIAENERLRAELGRLDAVQAEIARVNQDNDRLRAERDDLLAAFRRMADLVEQVRHSRGGGGAGEAMGAYAELRGFV